MMHRLTTLATCLVLLAVIQEKRAMNSPSNTCLQKCPYAFVGCFEDRPYERILSQKFFLLSPNSPYICQLHCRGFRYSGVAFGNGCFCGNYLRSSKRKPHGCRKECKGNKLLTCGDNKELQVYVLLEKYSS